MEGKTLLVVGSGCQHCREYALRAMASKYRIIVADDCPPTWQTFAAEYITVPLTESQPLLDAIGRRNLPVDGVVTYVEQYLEVATKVAAALGLRHNTLPSVRACRDKLLSRRLLAAARVPSPQSIPVASMREARLAAEEIGFPVVVKPRTLAGSLGVTLVRDYDSLAWAFSLAASSRLDGVDGTAGLLIEQYLDGPQISVECVSSGGRTVAAAVTDHIVGFPPHFEQGGHVVDAATPRGTNISKAVGIALAAVDALMFTVGVSHVEMRLTSAGPYIVEVNGRLAGARIPYLWRLASGVDLALAAADVALGETPDLMPKWHRAAAIRHLYPTLEGRIESLEVDHALFSRPWFHELTWEKEPGDAVKPPPNGIDDVLGFLIVTGPNGRTCRRWVREAASDIDVRIQPSAPRRVLEQCVW